MRSPCVKYFLTTFLMSLSEVLSRIRISQLCQLIATITFAWVFRQNRSGVLEDFSSQPRFKLQDKYGSNCLSNPHLSQQPSYPWVTRPLVCSSLRCANFCPWSSLVTRLFHRPSIPSYIPDLALTGVRLLSQAQSKSPILHARINSRTVVLYPGCGTLRGLRASGAGSSGCAYRVGRILRFSGYGLDGGMVNTLINVYHCTSSFCF